MKTSSCKNKGRLLQQYVASNILHVFEGELTARDVVSTSMGAQGADIKLSEKAFKLFPYAIECKNQERVNVWQSYEQAREHGEGEPLLIIKKNRQFPLAVVDLNYFIELHRKNNG